MITREFNLYLHAGHSIPLVINANQYDHGEQWLFKLFNSDGTQYTPSSGAIVGIKSDNLGIINTGSVDVQGRVVINETQQMTAAVGKAVFELLIDDQTHGTANFIVLVEPKPGDQADLSESDLSLIQQAIDGTSATAIAQGVSDWMDENLTPTTPVVDTSLTVQGAAADSAKVGQELSDLKSQIINLEAIPYDVKIALDTILQNVAFKNDVDYSSQKALIHAWAEEFIPLSILAEYTQGTVAIYPFYELDYLRNNLSVWVTYSDASVGEVEAYTLSGTLTGSTSTITASYNGLSSPFEVLVTTGNEFSYSPTDGSFVDLPYANWNKSASSGITTTWSLANGTCFSIPKEEAKWSQCNLGYFNYTNSAHFTMEFKFTQLAYYGTTNTGSPGEFTVNIRDVTKAYGSTVGFARDGSTTADIKIRTSSVSASKIEKGATVSLNTWHTLEIVIAAGKQTVLLDETEILTNANLSTGFDNYFTNGTCIGVSSHASSTSTIYIRNIEYSAD